MSNLTNINTDEIKATSLKYNLHSWSTQGKLNPIVIAKAEGIFFWDMAGKKYYDMSSQLVNLNIGHQNKKVVQAIKDQADKITYINPSYAVDVRSQLAKEVVELAPDNMAKVFFTLGGADANENAIKIAKLVTGRYKLFSRYRSYHGATYGAANATGEPRRFACEPGIPGFVKFFDPYIYRSSIKFSSEEEASKYYIGNLREQLIFEGPASVAAILIETITGSNGVIIPPKGYLKGIRALCDEFGIIMICDEVMCGFGRTGTWFACNNWAVKPDMITFAKGITCGYVPLGGVLVSKAIAEFFDTNLLSCGLTYSAHPLACAAGLATLSVYREENLLQNARNMGVVLAAQLEALKEKHPSVGDVRYIGLFSAVELIKNTVTKETLVPYGSDKEGVMGKLIGMLMNKGFSTYSHENCILIAPPLIITAEEIIKAIAILDEVLDYSDTFVE